MAIPASAPRHATLFPTQQLPRTDSFNPDTASGVSWVKELPKAVSVSQLPNRFELTLAGWLERHG